MAKLKFPAGVWQSLLYPVYDAIEKLSFNLTYDDCLVRVNRLREDLR